MPPDGKLLRSRYPGFIGLTELCITAEVVPPRAVDEYLTARFDDQRKLLDTLKLVPAPYGHAYRGVLFVKTVQEVLRELHLSTDGHPSVTVRAADEEITVTVQDVISWARVAKLSTFRNLRTSYVLMVRLQGQLALDKIAQRFPEDHPADKLYKVLTALVASPRLPPIHSDRNRFATVYDIEAANYRTQTLLTVMREVMRERGYDTASLPQLPAF